MDSRCIVAAAVGLLLAARGAAAADFTLGFEGFPDRVAGSNPIVIEGYVTLTTANNPTPEGAQGWQWMMLVEGGTVLPATLKGLMVSTVYDQETDDGVVHHDPWMQDLGGRDMFAKGIQGGGTCLVSWALLRGYEHMVLQPEGTQRIAKIAFQVAAPSSDPCTTFRARFIDYGALACIEWVDEGWPPTVTFRNESVWENRGLRVEQLDIIVCAAPFRRGDANADAREDVSDVVMTLAFLFLGGKAPPCLDAADANDDGRLDVTDAVITLHDLFDPLAGDLLPPPGFACGFDPTSDALPCAAYRVCQ